MVWSQCATLLSLLGCLLLSAVEASAGPARRSVVGIPRRLTQQNVTELALLSRYDSNAEMEQHMRQIAENCGGVAQVIRWGKSTKGQDLLALELYAGGASEQHRPGFKYVGNLHGDEPSGRQLLLALGQYLCRTYQQQENSAVKQLLQSVSIVLIPSANPDGWDVMRRENSNGIDLNRNYPDPIMKAAPHLHHTRSPEQLETLSMMNFTLTRRFVGSLALHEGALVANYPFDGYVDGSTAIKGVKRPTPDDATFVYLAKLYAALHKTMASSKEFPSGITNGAQWYPVYGGMQDWNYLAAACLEITLELNDEKRPSLQRLAAMWEENREAMVTYPLVMVLGGLRGFIHSARDPKQPLVARIHVQGQGYNVTSAPDGSFYRPLAPGRYTVLIDAPNHFPAAADVDVPKGGQGLVLNVSLKSTLPPPASVQQPGAPGKGSEVIVHNPAAGPGGARHMTWMHVLMYVLGGPLLLGAALLLVCRAYAGGGKGGGGGGRGLLERWHALVGMSQRFHAVPGGRAEV